MTVIADVAPPPYLSQSGSVTLVVAGVLLAAAASAGLFLMRKKG